MRGITELGSLKVLSVLFSVNVDSLLPIGILHGWKERGFPIPEAKARVVVPADRRLVKTERCTQ